MSAVGIFRQESQGVALTLNAFGQLAQCRSQLV